MDVYTLKVEIGPNPDIPGGYWNMSLVNSSKKTIKAKSLKSLSKAFVNWTDLNDVGSSNLISATIYKDGTPISRMSYNGLVCSL
jgi:hypothetical protein